MKTSCGSTEGRAPNKIEGPYCDGSIDRIQLAGIKPGPQLLISLLGLLVLLGVPACAHSRMSIDECSSKCLVKNMDAMAYDHGTQECICL